MAREATVRMELMDRSSVMLRELPISRRFRESFTSLSPEKEMLPFWRTLVRASEVSAWVLRISPMSVEGSRSRHSPAPKGEEAYSASWEMILSYSRVFKDFLFIFLFKSFFV